MLKFVQAEVERKRKDNDPQIRLIDIIKNNSSNKNNYSDFFDNIIMLHGYDEGKC